MNNDTMIEDKAPDMRAPQVASLMGVSVATLYRLLAAGTAPPSYLVSNRLRLWRRHDVMAHLLSRRTDAPASNGNGATKTTKTTATSATAAAAAKANGQVSK